MSQTQNIRLHKTTVRRLLLAAGVLGLQLEPDNSFTYDDVVNIALNPIMSKVVLLADPQDHQSEEAPAHA